MRRVIRALGATAVTFVAALAVARFIETKFWPGFAAGAPGWTCAVGISGALAAAVLKLVTDAPVAPSGTAQAAGSAAAPEEGGARATGDTYHVTATDRSQAIGRNDGSVTMFDQRRDRDE